jgi:hypothetical protein
MTYIVAIALRDRVRFADVTKPTPEGAMTVIWARYPDAHAVVLAGKDQRAASAPSQKDLFDLMVARAAPWRQPDKSFRCDEAAARKLMVNVLENPGAELIRWDADKFNQFAEQAQTLTDDETFAQASAKARAAVKAAQAAATKMQAAVRAAQAAAAAEQNGTMTAAKAQAAVRKVEAAGRKMKAAEKKADAAVAEFERIQKARQTEDADAMEEMIRAREELRRSLEKAERRMAEKAAREAKPTEDIRSKWSSAFPQKPAEEPRSEAASAKAEWFSPSWGSAFPHNPAETAARQERDAEYRRRQARHQEELDAEYGRRQESPSFSWTSSWAENLSRMSPNQAAGFIIAAFFAIMLCVALLGAGLSN